MSYLVLARKHRPQAFGDVTGQEHVVQTLANAIATGRVAHAFLLCGPRGVGKTTTARLLARALNCEKGPTAEPCGECLPCREIIAGTSVDVVEIDGASNNGVDSVRELREAARYLPQRDRHKIFIIDEVHMLSVAAFNALLKTLEEPPPHVKFIFATTDPQKLPDTILSRCQRHNFRRVPASKMVERLRYICREEGVTISDRALGLVARQADGGMRDALSLLDQLISSAGLEIDDTAVEEALGLVDRTVVHELASALVERDGKRVIEILDRVYDRGIDAKRLCEELAQHLRDLVYAKSIGQAPGDRGDVEQRLLLELAGKAEMAQLTRLFDRVHHAIRELGFAAQPRLALEVALLSAVHAAPAQGIAELAARLESVAARLGGVAASPAPAAGPMQTPARQQQPPFRPQAAPPQRPTQLPTSDLLSQVEALTRGRASPRQAGARPAARRSTPSAGSDEEPHGAAPGTPAPASDPRRGRQAHPIPGGPRSPAEAPPRRDAPNAGAMAGPRGGAGGVATPPAFRSAPRPPGLAPSLPEPPPFDDEPPPPGDEDAPPDIGEEVHFTGPDVVPLPREAAPDGCASGACGDERDDRPGPAVPASRRGELARPPAADAGPAGRRAFGGAAGGPPGAPASRPTDVRPAVGFRSSGGATPHFSGRDDPSEPVHVRWQKAVDAIRRQNPIVGRCLSEGQLVWLRPGEVALGFAPANAFHRAQLASTFAKQVEELLAGWFGGPTRLVLQEAAADAPASVAEVERRAREERRARLRAEAREHPAVLAVQSILGGEIDDIEVLEER